MRTFVVWFLLLPLISWPGQPFSHLLWLSLPELQQPRPAPQHFVEIVGRLLLAPLGRQLLHESKFQVLCSFKK
jgi:hypothetical protein